MLESKLSPMYEAKSRFNEVHPTKQLLQLLDRVERIEKIIDSAIAVKREEKPVVDEAKPLTRSEKMKAAWAKRKAEKNDKN